MKKDQALNKFTKGLQLDMNPMSITSDTLVDCLNGTLITYNGNEYVLQNDMGNARVETATLPPGYIPLGSTSFGGIIYIVSHNPLENKYQIGSFPSPERNLSKDELGNNEYSTVAIGFDYKSLWKKLEKPDETNCPEISSSLNQIILCDKELHSSDKFKVFSNNIAELLKADIISGYQEGNTDVNLYPKYLRIDLISILSNGSVIKLTDNLTWTNFETETVSGNYYIYPGEIKLDGNSSSLEEYRHLVQSQYDVYTEKYPGQLGLLCSYEAPSSFNVGYDAIITKNEDTNVSTAQFYYYLNWTNENTGIHKNRVNPYKIQIKQVHPNATTNNTDINLITDIKLPISKTNWESSDAQNNVDYFSTKLLDDFYKDNFDVKNYLENWGSNEKYISDKLRKNDASDPQIVVKGPKIEYVIEQSTDSGEKVVTVKNVEHIVKLESEKEIKQSLAIDDNKFLNLQITPIMPYGKLNYLTQDLKINLAQLGTGTIDLVLYKYFIDDLKATVDFQFETYLELNKRIKSIDLNVYKLPNTPQETSGTIHTGKESEGWENVYTKSIIQQSYNTLNQHKIYFNDSFEKDNIYQLEIVVHYADEDRYYYRILHTTTIFNEKYFDTIDFSKLWLYPKGGGYGIEPILKITPALTGSLKTESIDLSDFDMFKSNAANETKSLNYETVINGFEKMNISISSNYDNIPLTLDESINKAYINITSSYSNVENGQVGITEIIETDESSKVPMFIERGQKFPELKYNIELKGDVSYSNVRQIQPYVLTKIDVPVLHRAKISISAKHESEGELKFYINDAQKLSTIPISNEEHKNIYLTDILRELRRYCDTNQLDIIAVQVGIESFEDDNCSIYMCYDKIIDGSNEEIWNYSTVYQTVSKPKNIFVDYLFVRSENQNQGMLLGTKSNINTTISPIYNSTSQGYFATYFNHLTDKSEIMSDTHENGFTYNSDHCFNKYVKQSKFIDIYTIESVDMPENPTINFDITFTIKNEQIGENGETPQNNLCSFSNNSSGICNLSFEEGSYTQDSDKHEISIPINNKSLLNSLLQEKTYNIVQIGSNLSQVLDVSIVNIEEIYVYSSNSESMLFEGKLDSNNLLLITPSTQLKEFDVQFNWEETHGNNNPVGKQGIRIKGFNVYEI